MRAVLLTETPPSRAAITEHLSLAEDVARTTIKNNQVLVRVKASALNIEDIMVGANERFGITLVATERDPVVLGQEFSGVVEEVGSSVKKFSVGDAVLGHKVRIHLKIPPPP